MYYVEVGRKYAFRNNTNAEQHTINEIHLLMAIGNDLTTEKITSRGRHQPELVHMSTCPRRVVDIKHSTTPWHVCLVVHQCFAAYTSFCLVGVAQQTVWQGATTLSTK